MDELEPGPLLDTVELPELRHVAEVEGKAEEREPGNEVGMYCALSFESFTR